MTQEIKGLVERAITKPPAPTVAIARIEDGGVWISNATRGLTFQVDRVCGALTACGYDIGEQQAEDGGLFIEIPAAEAIEDNI